MMKRFNLSEWAIRHRSLVTYFMLVISGRGHRVLLAARAERRPGLHGQDHGGAGRLARRHGQRHARADHGPHRAQAPGNAKPRLPQELYDRRPDHDLRQPEGLRRRRPRCRTSGTRCARRCDDIRNTLPLGIVGPGFNDEFGDTYGIVYGFTADGFTHRRAEGLRGRDPQAAPRNCRTSRRSTSWAPRTSGSMWSSRPSSWPASASTAPR